MHTGLAQRQTRSLLDDAAAVRKLEFNLRRNAEQDHTALIDDAARRFRYEDCRDEYWNPEHYSLLWGTPLWDQASPSQRVVLNQLYWVAYYAQIVSAEIATIFLNQVAAAGLYTLEDFRLVCDNLDLETKQERAHINAFKTVGEDGRAHAVRRAAVHLSDAQPVRPHDGVRRHRTRPRPSGAGCRSRRSRCCRRPTRSSAASTCWCAACAR